MSIRLSKAIKELNIGLSTAIDFLEKKGHQVESNPNTKLNDDEYLLLANEFNKDMAVKLESERLSQERLSKEKNQSKGLEGYLERHPEKRETIFRTKTAEDMPHIKTVGHIDIDATKSSIQKPPEKETKKTDDVSPQKEKEAAEQPEKTVEIDTTKATIPVEETPKKEESKPKESVGKEKETEQPTTTVREEKETEQPTTIHEEKKEKKETKHQEEEEEEKKEKKETKHQEEEKRKETENKQDNIKEPSEKSVADEKSEKKENNSTSDDTKDTNDGVFRYNEPIKLSGPVVTGSIDLDKINPNTRPKPSRKNRRYKKTDDTNKSNVKKVTKKDTDNTESNNNKVANKRKRINKKLVNVDRPESFNKKKIVGKKNNKKKTIKTEIDQEEVQKQIKETLARLSRTKKRGKGAKYRQERREQASAKLLAQEEQERSEEKILKLTEFVTVNELATMMDVSVNDVIGTCMSIGMMVSINQRLDAETINIVAEEFGFTTEYVSQDVIEALSDTEEPDSEEDLEPRAPIVTVMGHVDHGKTSLLDYVRNTNVIAGEAGGITQHIGAYNVKLANGQRITFLDTPGHEAFTAMRARGAKITDIAIIIVAADDDVMPQTKEAINHAAAAGVPIVFAINKIDKPGANPEKIKETLAGMNYLVEDWGGKYQSQDISAKQGIGIKELLEKVLLEAELLELKANPKRKAIGSIIESSLDKGRGYVTTLLVQNGSLHIGDILIAGIYHGKIKAMFNERNQPIEEARPAEPVLILGMNGAPQAGDTFNEVETEQEAKEIANKREQLQREQSLRTKKHFTLDELGRRIALGDFQELNIIVKGDVDGSIEALSDSLIKLSTKHIQVNVIHKAVGAISDSDILLAAASNAIIIGFQVRPTISARRMAEKEEIDIRLYSIIYDALEEIKSAMEGMLAPITKEEVTATVEVLEIFKISKVGTVAGCIVREGKVGRNNKLRIVRDGIVIYTGEIDALKRHKDDVKEIGTNFECGISVKNYNDIKNGDLFETFEEVEVKQKL